MRRASFGIVALILALAGTSAALPPGDARFRDGANHRVGDDSFAVRFGRAPAGGDSEALRMRTHLEYIRERLAAAPATRPELAARRTELLGYLGDYIASGTTPQSTQLPWRTPVFIDEFGNVCAVGYLIERSVGRALPERIARLHRFDFLEDIAAAMPEVRAWVAASGFTLDELASIQPGYTAEVDQWLRWEVGSTVRPPDGPYVRDDKDIGVVTSGAFSGGQMEGAWTRKTSSGRVIGAGTLRRGRGAWRSSYADGKPLAAGRFRASQPHGAWTFYHPSGRVAAEGRFARGRRDGAWQFYYDAPGKPRIASGGFRRGAIGGRWEHFAADGKRIGVSSDATPARWGEYTFGGHLLELAPTASGVTRVVHAGVIVADESRLEGYFFGDERLYVHGHAAADTAGRIFDAAGNLLTKPGAAWLAQDCRWNKRRRAIAHNGDITTLHGLLYSDEGERAMDCGAPVPIAPARGKRIDAMFAAQRAVATPSPAFVTAAVLRARATAETGPQAAEAVSGDGPSVEVDLQKTLAASLGWYVEFPHVDGRFIQVFYTLPGSGLGWDDFGIE